MKPIYFFLNFLIKIVNSFIKKSTNLLDKYVYFVFILSKKTSAKPRENIIKYFFLLNEKVLAFYLL